MSAFVISFLREHCGHETAAAPLVETLLKQGFTDPQVHLHPDCSLVWVDSLVQKRASERALVLGSDYAFCVGVLVYKDLMGQAALNLLLKDFVHPTRLNPFDFAGNFQVVLRKQNTTWIFGDPVGMIKLYRLDGLRVFSTSWLA